MSDATPLAAIGRRVNRLAPIDLDEVRETSDHQTRFDRKYLIPIDRVADLSGGLFADLRALEIGGQRSFRYQSVYFDTDDRVSYLAAARRRPSRFKVRTRTYLDTDECLLEVKVRDGRGRTVKNRVPYRSLDSHRLTSSARHHLGTFAPVADHAADLDTALTTRYTRSTMFDPASQGRVTVDTGLTMVAERGSTFCLHSVAVIETKSAGSATRVDRRLWQQGHRPSPFSKFAFGMAIDDDTLPTNKWHRVLRTWSSAVDHGVIDAVAE